MLVSKPEYHDQVPVEGWRKSRRSGVFEDNCVELNPIGDTGAVAMRDSKAPNGPVLVFTRAEVEAFVLGAKDGEFDDLI